MFNHRALHRSIRANVAACREQSEATFAHLRRSAIAWQKARCPLPPPDPFGLFDNERLGAEMRRDAIAMAERLKGAPLGTA